MKYTIYQPKQPSFMVDSNKKNYSKKPYNNVYEGEILEDLTNSDLLEKIFYIFNMKRPDDFKGHSLSVGDIFNMKRPNDFHGHSLSVGDIVVLHEDDYKRAYICDIFGWNKIILR